MKRREFLKKSTVITAGIASASWWWNACQPKSLTKGSIHDMKALFNVSKSGMKKLISYALSNGGSHADIFFEYRINSSLRMEEDIIKDASRGIIMGMGVRVIKGDQVGYAHTDDFSFAKMKEAAMAASHIASGLVSAQIAPIKQCRKKNLYELEELSIDADLKEKISLIERANSAAKKFHSKVSKAYVSLSDEMKQIMYMDSDGKYFTDVQPMLLLRCYIVAEDGTNRQGASMGIGRRNGLDYFSEKGNSPESIAVDAAKIAVTNLDAKPAPAGPQVVVLGPADSGVLLHEAVGHGLEADFNRKNLSNFSNRIGEKVASEQCTVVDSGLFPNMRGSINIDDEGNLPTEAILIENGILKGYMHDNISSKIMKAQPTGNGRRQSYSFPPIPRMTNTYMRSGSYDPEEIIKSVDYGVYAKRFGGGQVDITKGDFTFGVFEAYLIENGKVTAPLKDVTLIGNGPDVMTKVTMVGNNMEFTKGGWTCGKNGQRVPIGVGIPTVKVSEITVGGTKA